MNPYLRVTRVLLVSMACLVLASIASAQNPSSLTLLNNSNSSGTQQMWPGGIGVFACVGTWNGATVSLQFLGPDGATMVIAGAATTLTANGAGVFYLPRGLVQAVITGAGGGTSLTATAKPLPSYIG